MSTGRAQAKLDHVATLVVPAALGFEGIAGLRLALRGALANPDTRIVVLRGSRDTFCRGMDLAEISVESDPTEAPIWAGATEAYADVLLALHESRAITVAAVEGAALGGGVGLAAVCDMVVAADTATFALPELLIGIIPAIILPVLVERLGTHLANRWALTQASWKSDEALAKGLVDQLVSTDQFDVRLNRLLHSLMRAHPRGVAALKRLTRETTGLDRRAAIECGRDTLNALLSQVETRRDLVAFRDYGFLPGEADA